jgi:hypothetical protein
MLNDELNYQLQRKADLRKKITEQCDTFQHLGPQDSLSYNWVRHSTECQAHVPAHELAPNFHSVKAGVLELLAESPTTSPRTLEVLAFNRSRRVRQAVADNPKTPLTALRTLAYDESPEVRFALAENHNMPEDILNILSEDENPYVRVRAQETLEVICEDEFIEWINEHGFKRMDRAETPIDTTTKEITESAYACSINCNCAKPGFNPVQVEGKTDTCDVESCADSDSPNRDETESRNAAESRRVSQTKTLEMELKPTDSSAAENVSIRDWAD